MEDKIISLLDKSEKSVLTIDEISSLLGTDTAITYSVIDNLIGKGILYRDVNNKIILVKKSDLKKGVIVVDERKGPIFIGDDDIEFQVKSNNSFYKTDIKTGDEVIAQITDGKASVVNILSKDYFDYEGVVVKENGKYLLLCDGHDTIELDKKYPLGSILLVNGDTNKVITVIGHKDDPDIYMKSVLIENGFSITYSNKYLDELDKIPDSISKELIEKEKNSGRRDLRNVPFVTIDGVNTKDFDDAVAYCDNTLYISIADFHYFIPDDSTIFKETLDRKISVYALNYVNPMYHHKISSGIGSIIPGEDRFAYTLILKLDDNGNIISSEITPSIIKSKMRMTYEDVNKCLDSGNFPLEYSKYKDMLLKLYEVSMKVKDNMLRNGYLNFSPVEIKCFLDGKSNVLLNKNDRGKAEELIQFLMMSYNLKMINYFKKHKLPFIKRCHDMPDFNKLKDWSKLLVMLGYKDALVQDEYTNFDISYNMSLYAESDMKEILDLMAVKSMAIADYSNLRHSHFALGQNNYATFTAPIRRLSDDINFRIYADSVKYGDDYTKSIWAPFMEKLTSLANEGEINSERVEAEINSMAATEYMKRFSIGTRFNSRIIEIHSDYIKVLLDNGIVGIIYLSYNSFMVSDDYLSLIKKENHVVYKIGDRITPTLAEVDLDNNEIVLNYGFGEKKDKKYGKSKKKIKKEC